MPRVSVITVFHNGARFIEAAVESVLAQTYSDWELLLVDDGSTDGSSEIARRFAGEWPDRIRYLEHAGHENRGASAARNLGLEHATGEFVAFLDADDLYLPGKLSQQVDMLDAMPHIAMLYGRSLLWFGWTGDPEDAARDQYTTPAAELDREYAPTELFAAHLVDPNVYPTTCSVLIRRSAIDDVGAFDESFRTMYEDVVLFMKILFRYPVYVASACWDRYRRHPDSCWAVAMQSGQYSTWRPYAARETFLLWVERYLDEQGARGTGVWNTLQQQLLPYRRPLIYKVMNAPQLLVGTARERVERLAKRYVPARVRRALRNGVRRRPWVGWVRFGHLRRLTPISPDWGYDRGTPVDRYYIESFLARHSGDVHGRVLEIAEDMYTRRFGGERVTRSDVLHYVEGNPQATLVGDLADGADIPSDAFDCVILTQTLQYIYDVPAAVRTVYRILKPGGVLLATLPGISEIGDDETGAFWHWSFTPTSARRVLLEAFPANSIEVQGHGNVLVATAFLHGIAAEELRREELDHRDSRYVVSTTVRAVKPANGA